MPKLVETTEDIQIEIPNEKIVDCEYGAYIPILAFTDTATYSFFPGKGIDCKTGKSVDSYTSIFKLFDFSTNSPIYKKSYAIIRQNFPNGLSPEVSHEILKLIGFKILSDLASIDKVKYFLITEYEQLGSVIQVNIEKYSSSNLLPQIPFLKESIDVFFNSATSIISHFLTFFDIKYLNGRIDSRNAPFNKCINYLQKNPSLSNNELLNIFISFKDIEAELRNIRNCLYHPEDHLFSVYIYNIHFSNYKTINPPTLEFAENKLLQYKNISIIDYIDNFEQNILNFSENYLQFMARLS